ncbi:MAG: response regulator, partial [Betaproteobacteria bacterium]
QPGSTREDGRVEILFSVIDSGIGIPVEKQISIFQPFTQVDHSTARHYGGTGLGLAIVAHLVELMGGKISVESTVGVGSTFRFNILLRQAEPLSAPPVTSKPALTSDLRPLRILLAEDNVINQKVAMSLLRKQGHIISLATNGVEVLSMYAADTAFDIVLMDVQMPQMDGLEATRLIRAQESGQRRIPIVALTANASQLDREICLAAGMDDFVSKPFQLAEITDALARNVRD